MPIDSIASSAATKMNGFCSSLGKNASRALNKSQGLNNFLKAIEPTGANNSFIPMTALMVGMVICPRVITAAKRNPDDKEATKDEIAEILFRDVQTVVIILFFLKMLNSIIAGKASKMGGLPMTNKPYQQVFDTPQKGLASIPSKVQEFIHSPIEKLKRIGQNVLDTIHPTSGVRALTNDEFVSRYSNVGSITDVQKLFKEIDDKKGNPEKIFSKVINTLISEQNKLVEQYKGSGAPEVHEKLKGVLQKLQAVKDTGYSALSTNPELMDADVQTQFIKFFQNPDNKLVRDAKKLNAALRTGALAIESIYLGFGLPALNQKRLEKKYLSEHPQVQDEFLNRGGNFNPLLDRTMKPQEIKVFKSFVG